MGQAQQVAAGWTWNWCGAGRGRHVRVSKAGRGHSGWTAAEDFAITGAWSRFTPSISTPWSMAAPTLANLQPKAGDWRESSKERNCFGIMSFPAKGVAPKQRSFEIIGFERAMQADGHTTGPVGMRHGRNNPSTPRPSAVALIPEYMPHKQVLCMARRSGFACYLIGPS